MKFKRKEIVRGLLSLIAATSIPIFACDSCEYLFVRERSQNKNYTVSEKKVAGSYFSTQTTQVEYKI